MGKADIDLESILSDSSRSLADYVTATVGNDPQLFTRLYDLSMQQKRQVSMRAARVMDFACERHPELIRPFLKKIIRDLPGLKDDSVKRIFMHILIRHSWVEEERLMGRMVDTLFRWLQDEAQPIAIKAYAMVILENITLLHPDLKNELALVIEEALPYWTSAGLQVQGKRTIRNLRKSRAGSMD